MTTALGLLAVLALILIQGFYVAGEFAFVAVRRGRLEELAEGGDRRAARGLAVHKRLSFMLSGAQLGITVTSLVVGFIAEPTIGRAIEPLVRLAGAPETASKGIALTIGFVLATAAQMVFGELGPKNLAIAEPERVSLGLARSTYFVTWILGPVIKLFDGASNRLLRLFGVEPVDELTGAVSADELEYIINESTRGGALAEDTASLLSRALEFRELRASDTMVARTQVDYLNADATGAELRRLAVTTGHSRFPVAGESLDDVLGFVQAKDLLRIPHHQRETTPVRTLLKPVLAIPESTPLGPLLGDMRSSHSQLAVVVDEYGGTAGIVTLEDIVEELVGEIRDEYDPAEPEVRALDDGSFLVPGGWRVDECARDTGVELPEGDYDTVGGLIMERLGRVPRAGDVVDAGSARLTVESMDQMAVEAVRLERRGET